MRLKYSSPHQLPTTRQEPELMFRNNELLHHNVITTAGLLAYYPKCNAGKHL